MKRKMILKPEMLPGSAPIGLQHYPSWLSIVPELENHGNGLMITKTLVQYADRYGRVWTIPPGYPTDGMSYPWPISLFWDRFDTRTIRSAILHDYTYSMHDYFPGWPISRRTADDNLLDGLKLDCRSRARRCYIATRLFGAPMYHHIAHSEYMISWLKSAFNQ